MVNLKGLECEPEVEPEVLCPSPLPFFACSTAGPSCAYCPYERQSPGGTINAVHRDAVRAGIRHIGELTGRMDGYRGRRYLCSYRSYGR